MGEIYKPYEVVFRPTHIYTNPVSKHKGRPLMIHEEIPKKTRAWVYIKKPNGDYVYGTAPVKYFMPIPDTNNMAASVLLEED